MNADIVWDESKRQITLNTRGLDFADAGQIFASVIFEYEDNRQDYGECRMICLGYLAGRMIVIGYVQRGESRHIFSMRKANEREQSRFGK